MTVTLNTAEGGTPGVAVSQANSGGASGTEYSEIVPGTGGSIQYTSDSYYKGKVAIALTAASGVQCYIGRTLVGARSGVCSFMIKFDALPSGGQIFAQVVSAAGTTRCALIMSSTGALVTADSANAQDTASASVFSTGVWYRIEFDWTNPTSTTGTLNVDVYLGDNTTPIAGMSKARTGMNNGTSNAGFLRIGKQTTSGTFGTMTIDDVKYNDGSTVRLGVVDLPDPDNHYVGVVGETSNVTSQTNTLVDLANGAGITVGNYLIARVVADNSGTDGAAPTLSVTDPGSNVWTVVGPALQDPSTAASGVAAWIAYAEV
jgi:hypothetical protein